MSKISELYIMETEKEDNQDDEIIRQEMKQKGRINTGRPKRWQNYRNSFWIG